MPETCTHLLGILGWPVHHSLSPAMHNAALKASGIDGVYLCFEVPPERLRRAIRGIAALGALGCNITIPHKETALSSCGRLTAEARRLGAVNTLTFEDGVAVGHNTDGAGFLAALRVELGFDPRGARVLVLGAGGAARAVVGALMQARADEIAVAARVPGRVEGLIETLAFSCGRVVPWSRAGLEPELAAADLVVSCLPPEGRPPGLAALGSQTVVLDLVYHTETALLRQARQVGVRTADGLEMLVQQGARSFELWTHRPAPVDRMRVAARVALQPADEWPEP